MSGIKKIVLVRGGEILQRLQGRQEDRNPLLETNRIF